MYRQVSVERCSQPERPRAPLQSSNDSPASSDKVVFGSTSQRRLPPVASRWICAVPISINEALSRLSSTCLWFVDSPLPSPMQAYGVKSPQPRRNLPSIHFPQMFVHTSRNRFSSRGLSVSCRTRSTSLPQNPSHNLQFVCFSLYCCRYSQVRCPQTFWADQNINYARAVTRTTFVRTSTSFPFRIT